MSADAHRAPSADGPPTPPGEAVVVWGGAGHGAVVAEAVEAGGGVVVGVLDDTPRPTAPEGHRLFTSLADVAAFEPPVSVALGVGANAARLAVAARAEAAGLRLATVVHPRAWVSPSAVLGAGTVVMAGAVVQARARLGRAVIVNTGATVDHDSELGDGAHISPGAHLAGHVRVGARAWVGAGASVRDRVAIGADAVVGVGAAVVGPVAEGAVAFGVPARPRPPAR